MISSSLHIHILIDVIFSVKDFFLGGGYGKMGKIKNFSTIGILREGNGLVLQTFIHFD